MSQTISVNLPASTIYVSGTVNGIEKTWTNVSGNTWETTAEISEDGKYIVRLTLISASGATSQQSLTLYYGVVSLITDRNLADVMRVQELASISYSQMTGEEKAEWDSDLKGAYNASDFNRVESAVAYLAGLLRALPDDLKAYASEKVVAWDKFFNVPYDAASVVVDTKTDWKMTDIQTPQDMARYLDNVAFLRGVIEYATATLPATMDNLAWQGANAIEQVLVDLDEAIEHLRQQTKYYLDLTAQSWHFSGEIFTGEV